MRIFYLYYKLRVVQFNLISIAVQIQTDILQVLDRNPEPDPPGTSNSGCLEQWWIGGEEEKLQEEGQKEEKIGHINHTCKNMKIPESVDTSAATRNVHTLCIATF